MQTSNHDSKIVECHLMIAQHCAIAILPEREHDRASIIELSLPPLCAAAVPTHGRSESNSGSGREAPSPSSFAWVWLLIFLIHSCAVVVPSLLPVPLWPS